LQKSNESENFFWFAANDTNLKSIGNVMSSPASGLEFILGPRSKARELPLCRSKQAKRLQDCTEYAAFCGFRPYLSKEMIQYRQNEVLEFCDFFFADSKFSIIFAPPFERIAL